MKSRKTNRVPFLVGAVVAMFGQVPGLQAGGCELPNGNCERVQNILKSWKTFSTVEIALAQPEVTISAEQPTADVDAANAKAKEDAAKLGPCYYDESESRVELTAAAIKLSDDVLAECLAGAMAQAKYHEIEARWLEHLGSHEAWVVKGGTLTKVSVENKLQPVAARGLWSSLAARELVAIHDERSTSEPTGRAIASGDEVSATGDKAIRELLGQ